MYKIMVKSFPSNGYYQWLFFFIKNIIISISFAINVTWLYTMISVITIGYNPAWQQTADTLRIISLVQNVAAVITDSSFVVHSCIPTATYSGLTWRLSREKCVEEGYWYQYEELQHDTDWYREKKMKLEWNVK